jgi:uncharacterized lipoprotein YehR (DUF1307 family)
MERSFFLFRKILLSVVAVVVIFTLSGCGEDQVQQGKAEQEKEEAAAIVNGKSEQGQEIVKQLEKQVLDELIYRELLLQDADKKGYKASDDKVNEKLEGIKSQFPDQDQFEEVLKTNKLTLNELKQLISKEIKIEQYIQSEVGEVSVTEEEMKKLYDQHSGQGEELPDFEELKPQLEEQIKQQKTQTEIGVIVERLKNDSEIEILI